MESCSGLQGRSVRSTGSAAEPPLSIPRSSIQLRQVIFLQLRLWGTRSVRLVDRAAQMVKRTGWHVVAFQPSRFVKMVEPGTRRRRIEKGRQEPFDDFVLVIARSVCWKQKTEVGSLYVLCIGPQSGRRRCNSAGG